MKLSPLTDHLVKRLDQDQKKQARGDDDVSTIISEVASWYEKLRNALEYKEEEVILRAAIERILKRRIVFGGTNSLIGRPLVRELIWAKYLPESIDAEPLVREIDERIKLFYQLEKLVSKKHRLNKSELSEWIIQLLSSDIERLVRLSNEKELLCNFIFQLLKERIILDDADEETRDIQVYLAVRKAFAKEDISMLRYDLFTQFFGQIKTNNLDKISDSYVEAVKQFKHQLSHPYKDRVYSYVKKRMPPFFILEDVILTNKEALKDLLADEEKLTEVVLETCKKRYDEISKKISTAMVRSIIFIFLTKAVFGLTVETSAERFLYGSVNWLAIGINTAFSPILMFFSTLFIPLPNKENSQKILSIIKQIVYEEKPQLGPEFHVNQKKLQINPILWTIYLLLWFLALGSGLYGIDILLTKVGFNPVSKIVFCFFLAVVSFMCYRISQTTKAYIVTKERQGIFSLIFDFFFVPFIQIGKYLTLGIGHVNIFLFVFDYIIETPFKEIFAFIEQWLFFLRNQRETLD